MHVQSFTFNPFQTNCYVCHSAGEAVLVDPSCATAPEKQTVADYIEENDLTIRYLLLTHAHIDHIFGCAFFAERYGQSFKMHEAEQPFIERSAQQAEAFGVDIDPPPSPSETDFIDERDTLTFGDVTFTILHTPGHSPGSLCFHDAGSQQVISGDVLFQGSIGRTEGLPQTSLPQLLDSIVNTLLPLGDATTVYPGHGPVTTIGRERQSNPFLQEGFRAAQGR